MKNPPETKPYWVTNKTSQRLWDAYLRMLEGKPNVVDASARMTLSSVAEEAGFQRSTLSRKRFPDLAELIETNHDAKPGKTMHAMYQQKAAVNSKLRGQLDAASMRRSVLVNRVAELASQSLEMAVELERLREQVGRPNVVPLKQKRTGVA